MWNKYSDMSIVKKQKKNIFPNFSFYFLAYQWNEKQ